MPKRYRGVVRGGVVVLEPDAQLPEGTYATGTLTVDVAHGIWATDGAAD